MMCTDKSFMINSAILWFNGDFKMLFSNWQVHYLLSTTSLVLWWAVYYMSLNYIADSKSEVRVCSPEDRESAIPHTSSPLHTLSFFILSFMVHKRRMELQSLKRYPKTPWMCDKSGTTSSKRYNTSVCQIVQNIVIHWWDLDQFSFSSVVNSIRWFIWKDLTVVTLINCGSQ